uniref:Uncharacterized protein n=1 Tax=Myoviridae sp. ctFPV8 TaxID=2825068 RepID=A0A8S5PDI8_9CAUD|nr:MAG TPA: hypothetical protein [Myoviridae sp. ctFPV8]
MFAIVRICMVEISPFIPHNFPTEHFIKNHVKSA